MSTPMEQYAAYNFEQDMSYQQGLDSIRSSGALEPSSEGYEQILRQTRVFYFNKITGSAITLEQAREAELSRLQQAPSLDLTPQPNPGPTQADLEESQRSKHSATDEDHVLTFNELQELIQAGKLDQIPNNKNIPNILSTDLPSESKLTPRSKPWEVTSGAASTD